MNWTAAEDDVLIKYGHKGAEWCRRELHRRFGVKRSRTSVEVRASRIGASLSRFQASECPECHREFTRLVPATGLCRECTARANREALRLRKERIQRNDAESKSEEVERIRREANALRKWCNVN